MRVSLHLQKMTTPEKIECFVTFFPQSKGNNFPAVFSPSAPLCKTPRRFFTTQRALKPTLMVFGGKKKGPPREGNNFPPIYIINKLQCPKKSDVCPSSSNLIECVTPRTTNFFEPLFFFSCHENSTFPFSCMIDQRLEIVSFPCSSTETISLCYAISQTNKHLSFITQFTLLLHFLD